MGEVERFEIVARTWMVEETDRRPGERQVEGLDTGEKDELPK